MSFNANLFFSLFSPFPTSFVLFHLHWALIHHYLLGLLSSSLQMSILLLIWLFTLDMLFCLFIDKIFLLLPKPLSNLFSNVQSSLKHTVKCVGMNLLRWQLMTSCLFVMLCFRNVSIYWKFLLVFLIFQSHSLVPLYCVGLAIQNYAHCKRDVHRSKTENFSNEVHV